MVSCSWNQDSPKCLTYKFFRWLGAMSGTASNTDKAFYQKFGDAQKMPYALHAGGWWAVSRNFLFDDFDDTCCVSSGTSGAGRFVSHSTMLIRSQIRLPHCSALLQQMNPGQNDSLRSYKDAVAQGCKFGYPVYNHRASWNWWYTFIFFVPQTWPRTQLPTSTRTHATNAIVMHIFLMDH